MKGSSRWYFPRFGTGRIFFLSSMTRSVSYSTRLLRLFHFLKFHLRGEVCTRSQIPPILRYAAGDGGDAGGAGRVSGGGERRWRWINKQFNQHNRASYVRCDVISSHGNSPLQMACTGRNANNAHHCGMGRMGRMERMAPHEARFCKRVKLYVLVASLNIR